MIDKRGNLSRKKHLAIAALLESDSIRKAAKEVPVGESTIFRWLQDEEFKEVYRNAKRQIVDHAISRLQGITGEAVRVLREIMVEPQTPPSARVAAARTILDTALKAIEVEDLEVRVEKLEEATRE